MLNRFGCASLPRDLLLGLALHRVILRAWEIKRSAEVTSLTSHVDPILTNSTDHMLADVQKAIHLEGSADMNLPHQPRLFPKSMTGSLLLPVITLKTHFAPHNYCQQWLQMFLHTVLLKAASTLKAMALSLGELWAGDLAHAESSPSCAGGQEGNSIHLSYSIATWGSLSHDPGIRCSNN